MALGKEWNPKVVEKQSQEDEVREEKNYRLAASFKFCWKKPKLERKTD